MFTDPSLDWSSSSVPTYRNIYGGITNLKSTRDASLGGPKTAGCLHAAFEFNQAGAVVLNPKDSPLIKVAGNCAMRLGSRE